MRYQSSTVTAQSTSVCDRAQLQQWMQHCRQHTLSLFTGLDHETLCRQAHADFSPIGWHLGHIAYTEGLWILEHLLGMAPQFPEYRRLFAADVLPKRDRVNLPTFAEIQTYLATIRTQVFAYLRTAPLDAQARLWLWLLQHESQHAETIAIVLALQGQGGSKGVGENLKPQTLELKTQNSHLFIPAGTFEMGNESLWALDNERSAHQVNVADFWIDRAPVTCEQYHEFIQAEGYSNSCWWTEAGWAWLQQAAVDQPRYWLGNGDDQQPVCGVSWYEAAAYAKFAGKRLPTEAEWEKAAVFSSTQSLTQSSSPDQIEQVGQVWEWTTSWFGGYPGFEAYPYRGYSQAYFDGQHRVLRGGSWATQSWSRRSSFRNWYHPHVREIFAGFRCVKSDFA